MDEAPQQSSTMESPVDRAFRVLQAVVASNKPVGVRDLGRRTGLPRSTTSRLVSTLERLRMVDRTPSGEVVPGPGLTTLQIAPSATPVLREQLHTLLVDLVGRFGENAALAVDDGDSLLYVSNVASSNPVSVGEVEGEKHPFHLVAAGLIAMAAWPTNRLTAYLDQPLVGATDHSVTSPKEIEERLRLIRKQGYSWTDQELDIGINGLAVRVPATDDQVAIISLYGPSYRFSPSARPTLSADLRDFITEYVERNGSR